jgi:hypothetical protein
MFEKAIVKVNEFTRPLLSIMRFYESEKVIPGAATMFFVNNDGWALTCRHVAEQLIAAEQITKKYMDFKNELAFKPEKVAPKQWKHDLEKKYQYSKSMAVELKNRFINCVDVINFEIRLHKSYDIALIKFNNFHNLFVSHFPVFPKDTSSLVQGKSLCKIGYPFPEFTNYQYNKEQDQIDWNETGNPITPVFPLDGMVTRHLLGLPGEIMGFEMSSPGLRGQSGGPIFDENGIIWGMQFATNHLDLNFDINQTVLRDGNEVKVSDHAFLNVGLGIHINVIKRFLVENSVKFIEE